MVILVITLAFVAIVIVCVTHNKSKFVNCCRKKVAIETRPGTGRVSASAKNPDIKENS